MENELNSSVKNISDNQNKFTKSNSSRLNVTSSSSDNKDESILEASSQATATLGVQVSLVNSSGSTASANYNNSPKMGSRRIFTPQFKLQVLESYRNDNDCKGNQRATARKYNIHRRQIQKWLQCESSLRSSVANVNHNAVKHQFHNISMQQSQKHSNPANCSYGSSHEHSSHLSLNSTRAMVTPSLSAAASSSQAQGVFAAANLAAAVAAAAVAGAAGAMAITSSSSTAGTSAPSSKAVVSPLRPSAIIGTNRNTSATMSPLLHHHHHHHYGIPQYTHAPAGVPLSVPILTQHISHPTQHIHQQTQQPHQSYQYHNLAYTQTENKQQSSFLSSVSLPTINALSAAASSSTPNNSFTVGEIGHTDVADALQLRIRTTLDVTPPENKSYICNDEVITYADSSSKSVIGADATNPCESFSMYHLKNGGYPLIFPLGPMDLSLRPRRDVKTDLQMHATKSNVHCYEAAKHAEVSTQKSLNGETNIVDLTYRKRKVDNISNAADEFQISETSEKQAKLTNETEKETKEFDVENVPNIKNCSEENDSEIEVGTEEKIPPSKPVKLFKPYLLDDYEDNDKNINANNKSFDNGRNHSSEKSLWTNYSDTPPIESCRENTFQSSLTDNYLTYHESNNFLSEIKPANHRSAFSPAASFTTLSPTNFQCPKGSPVSSGYESSTSSYSESSLSSRSDAYGHTYCINLQMQTLYNDNILFNPSKHVQRWLDQEESNLPAPNSSIALFV